jgi:hypothetical protein
MWFSLKAPKSTPFRGMSQANPKYLSRQGAYASFLTLSAKSSSRKIIANVTPFLDIFELSSELV